MDVLVTGGAGFIGSNLVRSLVASGDRTRVLDDLSTGSIENLRDCDGLVELAEGDIRDPEAVRTAMSGVEVVFHLAALPSVARSVARPVTVNRVNVEGTLNVLVAARDLGVRRVVYASSSSVYGDTPTLPKHEDMPVVPLSPYAVSKLAGEAYCRAFSSVYGLETVSLRFFNVFGPWQDPDSEYAAVIPRFVTRMVSGRSPEVFGDGSQSRDFTFVANAIQACVLAAEAGEEAVGETMNVACGDRITVSQLVDAINEVLGTRIPPTLGPPRPGDVRHSLASIDRAERLIGYRPLVNVREGLAQTVRWYAERIPRAPVIGSVGG
jgi:nucleoside-diphosphate-sugar epimerase